MGGPKRHRERVGVRGALPHFLENCDRLSPRVLTAPRRWTAPRGVTRWERHDGRGRATSVNCAGRFYLLWPCASRGHKPGRGEKMGRRDLPSLLDSRLETNCTWIPGATGISRGDDASPRVHLLPTVRPLRSKPQTDTVLCVFLRIGRAG